MSGDGPLPVPVRRALLSVADKSDLVPFARALVGHGAEIISTGGTARALADAGVPVTPIENVTGFPEMMDGRVKTLHPKVHGGLLGLRDNESHTAAMAEHGIEPIDLVCIDLYPFERTVSEPGVSEPEAVEQIDIGGPAMIRSGAKNFRSVAVVTGTRQYDRVVTELDANGGCTTLTLRSELAAAAFGRTGEYDAAIASWLGRRLVEPFPEVLRLQYTKARELRYGENPHQTAALYRDPASIGPTLVNARQLGGKPLSYNNINDAAAALEVAKALHRYDGASASACVVKHTNPCGAAAAPSVAQAVRAAMAGDPMAAYGGILAVVGVVDGAVAERLCAEGVFLEVVAASEFEPSALERLKARWANLRLMAVGDKSPSRARKLEYRSIPGGMLVQDRDVRLPEPERWKHEAGPAPSPEDLHAAAALVVVCRALSSNAIAIGGRDGDAVALFGAGAGQMDRVASCRIAVEKAGERARGAIAVSDAFFPFPDGPEVLVGAGVRLIVHPGGSKRDAETFALCDGRGVTCLTTGRRHFRH